MKGAITSALSGGFSSLASSIGLSTTALGGFIGVVAGIAGAIALFDHLHISADESREALSNMQSDYDDTKSNVESLNSELETTQTRIDELNAKENLSLIEKEELSNLQAQNAELERTLELEEARLKIQAQKLAQEAQNNYEEWTTKDDFFGNPIAKNNYNLDDISAFKLMQLSGHENTIDIIKNNAISGFFGQSSYNKNLETLSGLENSKDNINYLIGTYEALEEQMQAVNDARDELLTGEVSEDDTKQAEALLEYYNTLSEKSLDVQEYMNEYASVMQEVYSGYENAKSQGIEFNDVQKQQYEEAKAFLTEYMKMYTGASEVEGGINTLLSKSSFIGVKDELVKAGEVSRNVLDGVIAKTPGLTEALDEVGISAQQLGDYIMAIADPDSLRIDEIKQELKDAFETDDYEINFHAGESADAVWNEFISDKSDEEIEIFYKYVNDNGIDISKYSGEDLEATFTVAVKGQENLQDVEDTFSSILSSEDITKQVDDFQSNISTIQDVLDKLKAGEFTDSDITDLKQQFPSLVTETENLESALNNLAVDNFISTMSSIQTAMDGVTDPTQLAVMKSFGEDLKKQLISALDMSDVTADDLLNNFKEVTSLDNWNPTAFQNSFGKLVSEFGGTEAGRAGLITLAAAIELDPSLAYADYETLKAYVEDNKVIADIEFSQNRIEELQSQMTALQDEATKVQDSLSLKEAKGIKPLVSDYTKLVNNSEQQVWNLKKQNAELRNQQTALKNLGLDKTSTAYQEIESQINANVSAIDQAKIAQIEWNEQASRLRYEPNEGLTAYNKAKSTRNAGDNYLDMMSGLKEAKEAYDAGLIGTDDFKEYARMISPSGATDPANFLENYGKVSEWFTEGADGVKTFLNELDSKGLAEFNEETQQWTYSIEDMAKAANQMGVSEEVMLAMFGRLEDYGFRNNYVSSVEDGVQRLSNLYSDLAKEEALLKEMESKPSEYTDEQVQSKKDLIESIKQNIDETGQSMDYVVANAGETYNTQIESAKSAIESLAEQRKNILDNNLYGENSEAVANQLEKQILGLAEENGLQLDLEYNVVGQEDVTNATNALRTLQENGKISIDLDFNKSDMSADELQQKIDELNETKATINVDDEGGQEALDEINAIINACETEKQLKLALDKGSTVNDLLQLTDEELINTLQIDTSQVDVAKQRLQEIAEGEEIPITVKIDESQFSELVSNEKQVDITATAHGIEEVQALNEEINKVQGKTEDVNANVTGTDAVIDLTSEINKVYSKSVTVNAITNGLSQVEALRDSINKLYSKSITVTTNYVENKASGTLATGTLKPAHASGTAYNVLNLKPAFANGTNISIPYDETALVNELGTEGLIRSGKLFEIPGGMHYQSLKKGDIILSVEQMRQLSLTGRASGKARAYAEGTIGSSIPLMNSYANSTVGGGSFQGGVATSSSTPSTRSLTQAVSNLGNTSTKSTKKVSSLSKALETLEKLFDWVEVKLERLQQSIDYSTAQSENAVGYKNKNSYLSTAQTTTSALISANNAGAKEYKAQADKVAKQVGLSTNLYNKIKNGTIDIQSLSENDKKRVEAVKEWYDKMLDCVQASEELKASQRELAQTKLDNITEEYDALITKIEHSANLINGFMEQTELKGYRESKNYYEALTKNATEQREKLVEERTALLSSLQESLDKGDFDKNSIEFQNAMNDINGITESIQEADTNILKFANDMRQIEWDTFDSGQERISQLIDEADFLINLMSNDKLFDDKGIMTDQGNATMGLYAQDYNTYMSQADKYATEIERINEELNNSDNKFNQDLINRKQELIEKQRDSIKAAEDEKQAMIDLVREGYDAQLEALQKTIDKCKDALKSQKELNDYQKSVSDLAEERSKLQKMVNVYSKIDTEEGRMKYQEYQNQLKEAQEELDQTEYDKYIADQETLLDDVYSQAEEFINEKLENTDALISELIATTNAKSNEIAETIATESEAVGYDLSNEMESIWGSNGTVTNVLSTYTGEFTDRMTTLQTAIDGILTAVQAEVNASDKQAGTDVVTSTTNNSENPQITGKTPTTTASTATTTATQTKTEDTKKDDKIIKIIKKGNSDKAAIAKAKKNYHGTLWYYIVDNYGHIPTFAIYKELGKALGVKAPNGFNTLAEKNKLLKALKAKGYASGTDYVKKDQWANLNEEGQEIITLSDGSILTPVKQGSGIINNPNTEKLLALANDYDKMQQFMSSIGVMNASKQASAMTELERQIMNSQVVNNNAGGNYQITNEITFSLPNVSNYKEFVSQLQHDKQFENMVVDMTLGRANGGSKLAKYKYHW